MKHTIPRQTKAGQRLAGIRGVGCGIVSPPGFWRVFLSNRKQTGNADMPIEPEAELQAVMQAVKGWRGPLMELLAPLQRPLLTLFICNALERKKPFQIRRGDIIGDHLDFELRQRPGEKKQIEDELALRYKCKATYVRRCHERVLKARKKFEEAQAWVQSYNKSHRLQ